MARDGLRSRLSGSVPVSIVVHLVLLMVLVVIPLLDIAVPTPWIGPDAFVQAAPAPPPPAPVAVVRPAAGPPMQVTESIPTSAPPTIAAEPPPAAPFTPIDALEGAVLSGLGGDGGVPSAPPLPVSESVKPPTPVRAAQLPEQPRKVFDVHPLYPEIARAAHVEGTVILEAVLDTTGRLTQLRVLRSIPMLDQAALDAVRQWRYSPGLYYGRPVSVLMTITVRFTLQQ